MKLLKKLANSLAVGLISGVFIAGTTAAFGKITERIVEQARENLAYHNYVEDARESERLSYYPYLRYYDDYEYALENEEGFRSGWRKEREKTQHKRNVSYSYIPSALSFIIFTPIGLFYGFKDPSFLDSLRKEN